jgi:hypothetical protein
VESEVPQTTEGSSEPSPQNVVRIGDWIGTRDELVPFGRRGPDHAPECDADAASPTTYAASDAPPSPEDFWGERAAAIHDALQGPAGDLSPTSPGDGAAHSAAAAGSPPRLRRLRVAMAAAAAIAITTAAGVALGLTTSGTSAPPGPAAAKTQVASVLGAGMDRILRFKLPLGAPRPLRTRPAAERHRVAAARGTSRPRYLSEPVHYAKPPSTTATVSHPAVEATTAQSPPATPSPAATSDTVSRPSSSSNAPSASVTPTGQSGALGPIQSPNG